MIKVSAFVVTAVISLLVVSAVVQAASKESELRKAAQKGKAEQVRQLLVDGASVNAIDGQGRTALMFAAEGGHVAVVELLLASGARIEAKDVNGESALDKAIRKKRPDVVDLLEFKSANSVKQLKSFIDDHRSSRFVETARSMIDSLSWADASRENTLLAYWLYMRGDENPKAFAESARVAFESKLQTSEYTEVAKLASALGPLIAPFTLDELRGRASGTNTSNFSFGGINIESSGKSRPCADTSCTVTVKKVTKDGQLIRAEVFLKTGNVSPLNLYEGDIGDQVLSLFTPVLVSAGNPIGFAVVHLFSGELRGSYLIVNDKAYLR